MTSDHVKAVWSLLAAADKRESKGRKVDRVRVSRQLKVAIEAFELVGGRLPMLATTDHTIDGIGWGF